MKTNLCDVYGFLRESNEELENLNSGTGETEEVAFMCVPELIKKGFIYDIQKNRKCSGYDTFVIIAPLEIGGKNILKKLL